MKRRKWAVLLVAGLCACAFSRAAWGANPDFTAGTKQMARRIDAIYRAVDPLNDAFRNDERSDILKSLATQVAPNSQVHVRIVQELIMDQLRAGDMEDSLKSIEELRKIHEAAPRFATPAGSRALQWAEALNYFRIGEEENCFALHGPEACLLPFAPGAFHKKQRGSREALRILTELLEKSPNDLKARWLLNLAYMTLGEYPSKVPRDWLIDPKVFESEHDIKRFVNVAGPLGLEVGELAGGSIAEDFDLDGDIDLMTSNWRVTGKVRLFKNNGDGSFTDATDAAGLTEARGGLNIMQADYNNDGWPDVLVLRGAWLGPNGHFPKSLLKNNGDGTFSDVSVEAKLDTEHPTQTAVWFDFDSDGWLDLFVGNETYGGNEHHCELFRNNRDGTFTDLAKECGVNFKAYVKGVTAGDYNNDGWPDLYLSCANETNLLLRNAPAESGGGRRFVDVTAETGVAEPMRSFPTWFFDYDNDGLLDIFVSGYFMRNLRDVTADYLGLPHESERLRLWRNKGDGTFADVTRAANLHKLVPTMGCNFGDLDNDGFLDFYLATGDPDNATLIPNRMFRNDGGQRFQDVTTSGGFGHVQKGHGVAFADFDNDGDQDVFTLMGGAYTGDTARSVLFENPGHGNRWLKIKLEGVQSNRSGVGSRIKIDLETPKGPRTIFKTVNTGGSFGSNPLRQEIGLGNATAIRSIEVFWPVTGRTQVVRGVKLDGAYTIKEGANAAVPLKLKTAPFAVPGKST